MHDDDEARRIEIEYKRSELRWRSDIENDVKNLVRLETARTLKYDAFLDKMIAREERKAEFQDAIIKKGITLLLISGIGSVFTLLWIGVKVKFAEFAKGE